MDTVLPLEQTDPELAEHIRLIVAGHGNGAIRAHPVRGFSASWRERTYVLWKRDLWGHIQELVRMSASPGRNALCPCGSGRKTKKCCGQ